MQMEKSQYRQTALVKNHVNSRIKWGLFSSELNFVVSVCVCVRLKSNGKRANNQNNMNV